MKSSFALGASFICIALIAFPGGLHAGTIYECRDQSGSVMLTDAPLGTGYTCKPRESFQEATEEEKAAWEKEKVQANEIWMQEERSKAEAEKRRQEEEAARQKKELDEKTFRYQYW